LGVAQDDIVDHFILNLSQTSVLDFLDGTLPFLIGVADLSNQELKTSWTQEFLSRSNPPTPEWPETLLVELTQSCNFACIMCSCRTGGFVPAKTMPLPIFGDLMRVFAPHIGNIRLNGYGETTIIPNLSSYLDCLNEFAFRGSREIITNLSGPFEVYERMINERFALIASWDATSADIQQAIRRGADFAAQQATLTKLGALVRRKPEQLVLLCTVQQMNLPEIPKMVDFAAKHGSGLILFNMVKEPDDSPWMDDKFEQIASLFSRAQERARECGIEIRVPDHIGRKPFNLASARPTSSKGCDRPRKELLVRYDLEVQPCNMFHPWSYGLLKLGDWEMDLEARFHCVWAGASAATYRGHVNKRPRHPYCGNCYWMR
jgi:MoaA/NifB/PqqE/SkfB family radical SAM enzyme